jgi:hypothetical protein
MSNSELSHEELIEARDKIRRELEILMSPSSIGGGPPDPEVLRALQEELRAIEGLLANH